MRDSSEFVDLCIYLPGIGLLLPVVSMLDRNSSWSLVLVFLLFVPVPMYVARIRLTFPHRLDDWIRRYAYLAFFSGLIVRIATAAMTALR